MRGVGVDNITPPPISNLYAGYQRWSWLILRTTLSSDNLVLSACIHYIYYYMFVQPHTIYIAGYVLLQTNDPQSGIDRAAWSLCTSAHHQGSNTCATLASNHLNNGGGEGEIK